MRATSYDRLSAEDNAFLLAEGPNTPMHVSAIEIFEAGPLQKPDGGIDADAIRGAYASVLHRVPRYRQKIAWIPFAQRAVWVDDPDFHLAYHVRHVSLPRPGGLEELKAVASRVMANTLDRSKPLWEIWIVEGLRDDRFAIIAKTHHCMIDGSAGVEMAQILLSRDALVHEEETHLYVPRPLPTPLQLMRDELERWITLPLRTAGSLRALWSETEDLRGELTGRLEAFRDLAASSGRSSETPLNGPIGPHRRFDWLTSSLDEVRAVRKALGCTVNDVVLATVTGAVRRFLEQRQVSPDSLTFRVAAPVSMRSESERQQGGNRVSSWIVELPVAEKDPLARVEAIQAQTRHLKETRQAEGIDMLMSMAEYAPSGIVSLGARMASGPINSVVTNVPGPQFPLYMLGARLVAMIPQVPLMEGLGLGIALMSYDGRIFWGFTADYELLPDLDRFVGEIAIAFEALAAAAGVRTGEAAQARNDPESSSLVH